jgi:tetratricopeptide (TPR) repeat protein
MKRVIFILAIIFLSLTADAQIKNESFKLEDKKLALSPTSAKDEKQVESKKQAEAIRLNKEGVAKALNDNNYEQAIVLFRKAIEAAPDCVRCLHNWAGLTSKPKNTKKRLRFSTI